jgi:hypothetical protein
MKRHLIAVAIILSVAGWVSPAHAATRSCTDDEEAEADVRLTETADDANLKKELIRQHLEFGVPDATGPTDNERILSRTVT